MWLLSSDGVNGCSCLVTSDLSGLLLRWATDSPTGVLQESAALVMTPWLHTYTMVAHPKLPIVQVPHAWESKDGL